MGREKHHLVRHLEAIIAANAAKVTIDEAEHERLKRADAKLDALEAGGVDNWEGYSEALRAFYADDDKDE